MYKQEIVCKPSSVSDRDETMPACVRRYLACRHFSLLIGLCHRH